MKKRLGLMVIVLFILALVLVALAYSSVNSKRIASQLELGQKYLGELKYEQAVATFKEALSIDDNSKDTRELLVTAYIGWADQLENEGDINKAIEVLKEGVELIGDQRLKDRLDELSSASNESHIEKSRYDTLDHCVALCEEGDYYGASAYALERYTVFTECLKSSNGFYLYGEGTKKLGIYKVSDVMGLGFAVYYGIYDNEMRQGTGVWFNPGWINDYYLGTWNNDKPNGIFKYYVMSMTNESNQRFEVYEGNVIDGLWDGLITSTDTNIPDSIGRTYFEKGKVILQDIEGESNNFTVYEMKNGFFYQFIPDEDIDEVLSNTYGIVGFGKEYFGVY